MNTFQNYKENDIEYSYDRTEFKRAFEAAKLQKGITGEELRGLISDETGIPEDTVVNHLRTDSAGCNPGSIETVKKYGQYLLGNEYAFLKHIPMPDEVSVKPSEELHSDSVKAVFGMLYDILALYESSDCFNRIPGTDDTDGAWKYFERLIGEVRKKLTADLLGKRDSDTYKKLERIIDETEVFVKS